MGDDCEWLANKLLGGTQYRVDRLGIRWEFQPITTPYGARTPMTPQSVVGAKKISGKSRKDFSALKWVAC
jgi:hypothetical protein